MTGIKKENMRKKIIILLLILILAILNYGIYEKQIIKDNGKILMLEVENFNFYSSIYSDYISLSYKIEKEINNIKPGNFAENYGYIVVSGNEENLAKFMRFYNNESLVEDEKLIKFYLENEFDLDDIDSISSLKKAKVKKIIQITPNNFFLPKKHLEYYKNVKYAIFKFSNTGKYILFGLADENKKLISPPATKFIINYKNIKEFLQQLIF